MSITKINIDRLDNILNKEKINIIDFLKLTQRDMILM